MPPPEPGISPARPRPAGHPAEWDGPDADGWSCAAAPGGGVLIVKPRASGGWVPVWTAPSGHIIWHGGTLPAPEAAQRAAEGQVRRQAHPRPKAS